MSGLSGLFPTYPAKPAPQLPGPVIPTVNYTPLPADQEALLFQPWDPFNKLQHVAHMNAWLMSQAVRANGAAIAVYMQGYNDWHTNALHDADLGLPIPPPPPPPVLQDVGPKAPEFWFQ